MSEQFKKRTLNQNVSIQLKNFTNPWPDSLLTSISFCCCSPMEDNSFVFQGIKSDAEMKLQMEMIPKSHSFLSCAVCQSWKLPEIIFLSR